MSRLFRAAGAISALTLASRVLGLWRDSVMAAVLGAGRVSDAFLLAWALPNLTRRLLGEGALSASLVPAYTAVRQREGEPAARSLLAEVLGGLLLILVPLVALVLGIGLLLGGTDAVGPDGALLVRLGSILFPYTVPICIAAMLSGALNTRGVFALPASAPIVLNVVWIAALHAAPPLGCTTDTGVATFLAWSLCLGGLLQLLLVLVPMLRARALARPRLRWPARGTGARTVFATMVPTVIGMSLGQLSSLLDQGMAYALLPDGSNTYLYLSNRLLLFPHALTALAVVIAVFPRLASEATALDRARMRATLDRTAAATLFVTVPAAAGLAVLAPDIVTVLFARQQFTAGDAAITAATTELLVAGLPFLGLAQLYARAFYSVGDHRTPALVAALLLACGAALNLALILGFGLGTPGLAAATSTCALLNAALLARALRWHAPRGTGLAGAWARSLASTAAMVAAIAAVRPEPTGMERTALLLWRVAIPIALGMAVYSAAQWLLRSPELRLVRRRR